MGELLRTGNIPLLQRATGVEQSTTLSTTLYDDWPLLWWIIYYGLDSFKGSSVGSNVSTTDSNESSTENRADITDLIEWAKQDNAACSRMTVLILTLTLP